MEIIEYKKKALNKVTSEKYDEMIKKLKKEHEKLIKGMFEFTDAQGGWLEFTYRYFKDDPLMKFRLTHGEICEIPAGIVKHLRNTRKKIRRINPDMSGSTGRGIPSTFETVSRVNFTPVDL